MPLTTLIVLPMAAGLMLILSGRRHDIYVKSVAAMVSLVSFFFSLKLFFDYNALDGGMQFVEDAKWISSFGIHYRVGIDGISLMMVVLTTLLTAVCVLCSWTQIRTHVKAFFVSLLFLEGGMIGVFCALDLFLFYIFWEAMLIPMYLIIGVWGGPRKIYAAVKFMIYTVAGSLLMFAAIVYLFARTGSFDVVELPRMIAETLPLDTQRWLFFAFFISFAIKVPIFPFHTWLPDAHVEAPTAGSVILAGVLLKMGAYGLLRFALPFFPGVAVEYAGWMMALGVIGIIFGALMAMMQSDIKKLIAYSSVSHLGFVIVGIFSLTAAGMQGGIYQMVNHGLSTGALFLMVGMIYDRTHKRGVDDYGGMAKVIPVYAVCFMIVTLSSIGLPGLNGFVGEFLILIGTFQSDRWMAVLSASGVVLGAVYMLRLYRDTMFGRVTDPSNESVTDMTRLERVTLLPILVLIFLLGIFPSWFLSKTEESTKKVLARVGVEMKEASQSHVQR